MESETGPLTEEERGFVDPEASPLCQSRETLKQEITILVSVAAGLGGKNREIDTLRAQMSHMDFHKGTLCSVWCG